MRLFVAAELPWGMREALADTSALLRASVRGRYIAPDSFHVTLAFLGEVEAVRVDAAVAALEAGCQGFACFDVTFGALGSFGKRTSATLWQGFEDPGDLPELATCIRGELRGKGFDFDEKSFKPHVTLMRKADVSAGFLPPPTRASGVINTVTLFRSDLSGPRPVYEPVHTVELR